MENKIIIKTSINKDISSVWEYYNNPEHTVNWNFASNDWSYPKAKNDLKIGRKLQSRMEAKDGSFGFDFEAIYDEIHDFEKIKCTITDGRCVVVDFKKGNHTTNLTVTFEAENTNSIDIQKNGWQAILNNFKAYTESKKNYD